MIGNNNNIYTNVFLNHCLVALVGTVTFQNGISLLIIQCSLGNEILWRASHIVPVCKNIAEGITIDPRARISRVCYVISRELHQRTRFWINIPRLCG